LLAWSCSILSCCRGAFNKENAAILWYNYGDDLFNAPSKGMDGFSLIRGKAMPKIDMTNMVMIDVLEGAD